MEKTELPPPLSMMKLFLQFFKIGIISFGGPAAHAALMERELVNRKKWISHQLFLDFLGAVNLIPGPNSTQMTMLVGYKLRGLPGMLVTGSGFVLPAACITALFAWAYVSLGHIPIVEGLFFGIKPAVIAVIAGAIIQLGKKAIKNAWLALLGVLTLAANWFGVSEIAAILAAGVVGMAAYTLNKGLRNNHNIGAVAPFVLLQAGIAASTQYSAWKLFFIFLKIGSVLFGSGYVLVAYMDGELVEKMGWLTKDQLLDAIAIGQFTPGPILSAATFVGFVLDGVPGAILATLGIFLPSFVFILVLYPLIPKLRKSLYTAAFLDAVNIAAVAVMLGVAIQMTVETATEWRSLLILGMALVATFRFKKLSAVWIILGGALIGYFMA